MTIESLHYYNQKVFYKERFDSKQIVICVTKNVSTLYSLKYSGVNITTTKIIFLTHIKCV